MSNGEYMSSAGVLLSGSRGWLIGLSGWDRPPLGPPRTLSPAKGPGNVSQLSLGPSVPAWAMLQVCPSLTLSPGWAWDLHCREPLSWMDPSDLGQSLSWITLAITLHNYSILFYSILFLALTMSWITRLLFAWNAVYFQLQKHFQGHKSERLQVETGFYFILFYFIFNFILFYFISFYFILFYI